MDIVFCFEVCVCYGGDTSAMVDDGGGALWSRSGLQLLIYFCLGLCARSIHFCMYLCGRNGESQYLKTKKVCLEFQEGGV